MKRCRNPEFSAENVLDFFQDRGIKFEDLLLSREEQEENVRVYEKSKEFLNTDPSEWAFSQPLWDLSLGARRFVTRERTEEALREACPNGLLLGTVLFTELDQRLVEVFRRSPDKLWVAHDSGKIAKIICNWSEGKFLTPPLLRIYDEIKVGEITITDGSHRLAVSRALKVDKIYILIEPHELQRFRELLPSFELVKMSSLESAATYG